MAGVLVIRHTWAVIALLALVGCATPGTGVNESKPIDFTQVRLVEIERPASLRASSPSVTDAGVIQSLSIEGAALTPPTTAQFAGRQIDQFDEYLTSPEFGRQTLLFLVDVFEEYEPQPSQPLRFRTVRPQFFLVSSPADVAIEYSQNGTALNLAFTTLQPFVQNDFSFYAELVGYVNVTRQNDQDWFVEIEMGSVSPFFPFYSYSIYDGANRLTLEARHHHPTADCAVTPSDAKCIQYSWMAQYLDQNQGATSVVSVRSDFSPFSGRTTYAYSALATEAQANVIARSLTLTGTDVTQELTRVAAVTTNGFAQFVAAVRSTSDNQLSDIIAIRFLEPISPSTAIVVSTADSTVHLSPTGTVIGNLRSACSPVPCPTLELSGGNLPEGVRVVSNAPFTFANRIPDISSLPSWMTNDYAAAEPFGEDTPFTDLYEGTKFRQALLKSAPTLLFSDPKFTQLREFRNGLPAP